MKYALIPVLKELDDLVSETTDIDVIGRHHEGTKAQLFKEGVSRGEAVDLLWKIWEVNN